MLGLLGSCFHLAFALVLVGVLCALSWCCALVRPVAFLPAVEAEAIVALFIALWVGYWLCCRALSFALSVAIALGTGRILALASLLWWQILLVSHHVVFKGF